MNNKIRYSNRSTYIMEESFICPICLDEITNNFQILNCSHVFCCRCLQIFLQQYDHQQTIDCPVCRQNIKSHPPKLTNVIHGFRIVKSTDSDYKQIANNLLHSSSELNSLLFNYNLLLVNGRNDLHIYTE